MSYGGADRPKRAHVGHDDREAVLAVDGHEGIADGRQSIFVPADEDDSRPECREGVRRRTAQARGRPGDKDGPSVKRTIGESGPVEQATPHRDAGPAEAPDDRQLQAGIDQR